MCYQYCNANCNSCSFCDFLRDLFTPVNLCGGYQTRQTYGCRQTGNGGGNVGCSQTWGGCVRQNEGCRQTMQRCPCCGYTFATTTNTNGGGCLYAETVNQPTCFGYCRNRQNCYGQQVYNGCYTQ